MRDWQIRRLLPAYGRRTQEIDPRYFFINTILGTNTFYTHQHCLYSEYTHKLINQSGSNVIVQMRNILDVTVSLADHLHKNILKGDPANLLPKGVLQLRKEQLVDYVIDIEIPWYIKFFEGWMNSELVGGDGVFVAYYEKLVKEPAAVVSAISDKFHLDFTRDEIENAIEKASGANTLKNVGIIGRGLTVLSPAQRRKIVNLLSYFDINEQRYFSGTDLESPEKSGFMKKLFHHSHRQHFSSDSESGRRSFFHFHLPSKHSSRVHRKSDQPGGEGDAETRKHHK